MKTYKVKPVGIVCNEFDDPADHHKIKEKTSSIIIYDDYLEALLNIKECEYLDIIFWFHKSESFPLAGKTRSGAERGIFASRSPKRPNLIGVTTVKLLECNANKLVVKGLDAINHTPVIDIKCCDTSLFASESELDPVHNSILKSDPRIALKGLTDRTDRPVISVPSVANGIIQVQIAVIAAIVLTFNNDMGYNKNVRRWF